MNISRKIGPRGTGLAGRLHAYILIGWPKSNISNSESVQSLRECIFLIMRQLLRVGIQHRRLLSLIYTFPKPFYPTYPQVSHRGSERGNWDSFWSMPGFSTQPDIPSLHRLGLTFWGSQVETKWGRKEEKSNGDDEKEEEKQRTINLCPPRVTDCISAVEVGYDWCEINPG